MENQLERKKEEGGLLFNFKVIHNGSWKISKINSKILK
jgi:hypothetical protein